MGLGQPGSSDSTLAARVWSPRYHTNGMVWHMAIAIAIFSIQRDVMGQAILCAKLRVDRDAFLHVEVSDISVLSV